MRPPDPNAVKTADEQIQLAARLLDSGLLEAGDLLQEDAQTRIGRYEVDEVLGEGATSRVYLARDPGIGRQVAIKLLLQVRPGAEERFAREMRLLAKLDHPNLVRVFDTGEHEGRPYCVLEFAGQQTLASCNLDLRGRIAALEQVARACATAHSHGIVHRDLKPANVFVGERVAVGDFGVAKVLDDPTSRTRTGVILGTPAYMAPEQLAGERTEDASCDIYAMGVMLYETTTGQLPFEAETLLEQAARVARFDLTPPADLAPGLDRELEAIILRAMARDPADRHPSAQALAEDLAGWLRGERPSGPAAPFPFPLMAAGLLAVAGVLGVALGALTGDPEPPLSSAADPLPVEGSPEVEPSPAPEPPAPEPRDPAPQDPSPEQEAPEDAPPRDPPGEPSFQGPPSQQAPKYQLLVSALEQLERAYIARTVGVPGLDEKPRAAALRMAQRALQAGSPEEVRLARALRNALHGTPSARLAGDEPMTFATRGYVALVRGDLEDAEAQWAEITLQPDPPPQAFRGLALIHGLRARATPEGQSQPHVEKALGFLVEALRRDPSTRSALLAQALARLVHRAPQARVREASAQLDRAARQNPAAQSLRLAHAHFLALHGLQLHRWGPPARRADASKSLQRASEILADPAPFAPYPAHFRDTRAVTQAVRVYIGLDDDPTEAQQALKQTLQGLTKLTERQREQLNADLVRLVERLLEER
jgi:serine/threonine protein kinase